MNLNPGCDESPHYQAARLLVTSSPWHVRRWLYHAISELHIPENPYAPIFRSAIAALDHALLESTDCHKDLAEHHAILCRVLGTPLPANTLEIGLLITCALETLLGSGAFGQEPAVAVLIRKVGVNLGWNAVFAAYRVAISQSSPQGYSHPGNTPNLWDAHAALVLARMENCETQFMGWFWEQVR